jgi:hypothetical protein
MAEGVDSLNVATAGAIALYQIASAELPRGIPEVPGPADGRSADFSTASAVDVVSY